MKHPQTKWLQLNVSPIAFHGRFRSNRESIKEITKITDTELTYSTYGGESVTKKIDKKYQMHVFACGYVPVYELKDGEVIKVFSFVWFDWRNYDAERVEKEREERLERVMKKGIKMPSTKRTYTNTLLQ